MRNLLCALALALLLSVPIVVQAQTAVPLGSVSERTHVTANGGAMLLTQGTDWSGASLGGTVLYNLHQKFSVFGGYDHGFPVNSVDEDLDFVRAVGSLRVHDNAFVGFGYGWFGNEVEGGLTQLIVTKQVMPRVALSGLYARVFSSGALDDFDYARVYVNYHLIGKE